MNLYKVTRTDHVGYDQYSAFVCAAHTRFQARNLHPSGDNTRWTDEWDDSWTSDRMSLSIELLGDALTPEARVILASFHAG